MSNQIRKIENDLLALYAKTLLKKIPNEQKKDVEILPGIGFCF